MGKGKEGENLGGEAWEEIDEGEGWKIIEEGEAEEEWKVVEKAVGQR